MHSVLSLSAGEPGLAGVYWSKGWWRWWVVTTANWSYKSCKAPVRSLPPTNQNPVFFYRSDALPVAQTTVSKHWREKYITFHGLAYLKLTWGLPTLSLTTNSFWLPWGRVAMPLISPLMSVPQMVHSVAAEKNCNDKVLLHSTEHISISCRKMRRFWAVYDCI